MSLMAFFVVGLICVVFWRQVAALVAVGVVVLFVAGVALAANAIDGQSPSAAVAAQEVAGQAVA